MNREQKEQDWYVRYQSAKRLRELRQWQRNERLMGRILRVATVFTVAMLALAYWTGVL